MGKALLFYRYKELGEALYSFFLAVRDAHGAVTRALLTAYAETLPPDMRKNFLTIGESRRERFFARWRRAYCISDRRISGQNYSHRLFLLIYFLGVQQFVPSDYKERVKKFHALLKSMMAQRGYQTIIAGGHTFASCQVDGKFKKVFGDYKWKGVFPTRRVSGWRRRRQPRWKSVEPSTSPYGRRERSGRCLRSGYQAQPSGVVIHGCALERERNVIPIAPRSPRKTPHS
jgi:hypothetical protein